MPNTRGVNKKLREIRNRVSHLVSKCMSYIKVTSWKYSSNVEDVPLLIALLVINRRQVEVMALFCQTSITNNSLQLGEVSHVFLFREEDQGRTHFICSNWEHFTSSTLGIIHLVITQGGLGYLVGLFLSKGWRGSKIAVFGVVSKWMPLILHKQ